MNNEQEKMQKTYKIIMLVVLTAFISFMITSLSLYTNYKKNPAITFISGNETTTDSNGIEKYLDKIKALINKNYLWNNEIDEQKLKDSAIEGFVNGLGDKYTEYIPKSEMQKFTEDITGSFVGIGIYMIADKETGKIIVYYPIPDSPAEKVGIKSGDTILSVNGIEYEYKDFDTIADHIKGEEGTKVKLVIGRDEEKLEFEIERTKIETNPIIAKVIEENIGYIKLPSFDKDESLKFKEKLDEIIKQGAKSLIIDLRNNGGGIVDESADIADLFLEKDKTIITTKDNKKNEEITKAKKQMEYDFKIVILTNENTASASEILTGALKDNNRAQVIGTKTYGKGVIQTVIPLSDGSGIKITTAEYYTPNGIAINEVGIKPDIEIQLPDTVKSLYSVKEDDDTQLKKAIEILKGEEKIEQ